MGRKKPISVKQRKAQLQEKRAIKRGDILPPEPSLHRPKRPHHGHPSTRNELAPGTQQKIDSARKLQSSFLKPSRSFLALSKQLASTVPLIRPISEAARHVPVDLFNVPDDLGCPRRPKWRFDMSKKEVELNEERVFAQWQKDVSSKLLRSREAQNATGDPILESTPAPTQLKSPTYYEHNLEVWRQLWRVTEISSILLILLDSRCPPLHIPPSLHSFVTSLRPSRQIIFILTKTGVVGEECSAAWKRWLEQRYDGVQVILSESYRRKPGDIERKGQGSRQRHEPYIPQDSLQSLVSALRNAHDALITPPDYLRDKPEKLARWIPRVRASVDWQAVLDSRTSDVSVTSMVNEHEVSIADFAQPSDQEDVEEGPQEPVKSPLTIGLIGQPNVGKSSLLNALFGTTKVKASRTPGKTKHFQTLFWTPEIRLVDCPGLVLPNYVPMELQALSSVLPISQIPSLPSCIQYASNILPLEEIFDLQHSSSKQPAVEDKRTWRVPRKAPTSEEQAAQPQQWTAMGIMQAHAEKHGWVTAKAGRPDVNRAGNAILRAIAENKIRWAFWPPGVVPQTTRTNGLWLLSSSEESHASHEGSDNESDEESDNDENSEEQEIFGSQSDASSSAVSDGSYTGVAAATSRFGVLNVDDDALNLVDDEEEN